MNANLTEAVPSETVQTAPSEAVQSWEEYLNREKWVYGMPGLKARPAYLAGYAAAQLAERERCAKLCEELWEIDGSQTAREFAAAIRKG